MTGEVPWSGLNPMQVGMQILLTKARPERPAHAPADLADLMERCWAHEASARPSFVEIKTELAASSTRAMIASPSSESLT